jgi:hypothetical protein
LGITGGGCVGASYVGTSPSPTRRRSPAVSVPSSGSGRRLKSLRNGRWDRPCRRPGPIRMSSKGRTAFRAGRQRASSGALPRGSIPADETNDPETAGSCWYSAAVIAAPSRRPLCGTVDTGVRLRLTVRPKRLRSDLSCCGGAGTARERGKAELAAWQRHPVSRSRLAADAVDLRYWANGAIFPTSFWASGPASDCLRSGVRSRAVLPRPRSPDPAPSPQNSPIDALLRRTYI